MTKPSRQRVERTRGGGRYTEAGFWGFIRSGLRGKYRRWGPRFDALAAAKVGSKYRCIECENLFRQKEVEVDHIEACGSLRSFDDIAGFVKRLFCEEDQLRVLCKPCHLKVTKENQ